MTRSKGKPLGGGIHLHPQLGRPTISRMQTRGRMFTGSGTRSRQKGKRFYSYAEKNVDAVDPPASPRRKGKRQMEPSNGL